MVASDPDALIISSEERDFSNALIPYLTQNLQSYLLGIGLEKPKLIAFGERQKNELRGAAAFIIQHAFESGAVRS